MNELKIEYLELKDLKEYDKNARKHQNVLVFYKGNIQEIKNNFPEVEIDDSMFE